MAWRLWKSSPQGEKEDASAETPSSGSNLDLEKSQAQKPPKSNLGVLNDKTTDEVPGSILLLAKPALHNEPLGLRHEHARTSASSLPSPYGRRSTSIGSRRSIRSRKKKEPEKKRTADGAFVLDPQPDDSPNDPLNWASKRRDAALLSIGFYCMVGGGMTPILAAGFSDVAETYGVSEPSVALTTGLYMMGLGIGSVIASPTAILFGKRPVYLGGAILFIASTVWCALSPTYTSLLIARIVQGLGVSPVECLPSATVAEIFFLHERAYRLGIYTLLLLGGKNLVPLVSAAIIDSLGWRWVFWMVAIILGFGSVLLFFFVPETFWDRTPTRHHRFHDEDSRSSHRLSRISLTRPGSLFHHRGREATKEVPKPDTAATTPIDAEKLVQRRREHGHVGFADEDSTAKTQVPVSAAAPFVKEGDITSPMQADGDLTEEKKNRFAMSSSSSLATHGEAWKVAPRGGAPGTPHLHNLNSPYYESEKASGGGYFDLPPATPAEERPAEHDKEVETASGEPLSQSQSAEPPNLHLSIPPLKSALKSPGGSVQPSPYPRSPKLERHAAVSPPISRQVSEFGESHVRRATFSPQLSRHSSYHGEHPAMAAHNDPDEPPPGLPYTEHYRRAPAKSYIHTLKPFSGRLSNDNWFKVMLRPFILFAYPGVLWSTLTYSFSIGWLIVLSEAVTEIYRSSDTYGFSALQCGLVYISPFIGGVLGTAVAGKVSDLIVRFMARRNDGIYEPEFRLVMAIPVALTTAIGLMAFGWSVEEHDSWIVPTIFFGVISFGCALGSTTAITFCVDSYRQYAGEALVTLNFSKNIFHGLVFSLFFTTWLEEDGPKIVFIAIGIVQMAVIVSAVPMYIYGKRARMWTVRKGMMEKL